MLTQSMHDVAGVLMNRQASLPPAWIATTDWTAIGLWATACLAAISLLAGAMNRRRSALTDVLKKHVVDTIGPVGGDEQDDGKTDE